MSRSEFASCSVALKGAGNTIQLLPAGEFRSIDGRPTQADSFRLDDASGPSVIAASARKNRLVIDYEHQSLAAAQNGQPVPAAGWFRSLEWRQGEGLFATDVEWTEKATAMIKAGEYRYISPVFAYDPKTGDVLSIVSAALTNTPALDGMQEVAALTRNGEAPGNGEFGDVSNDNAAQIAALVQNVHEATEAMKHKAAEAESAQSELAALKHRVELSRIEAAIDDALKGARLLPFQVEAARRLGQLDFAALTQLLDRPPLVPALLGMQSAGARRPGKAHAALSREELQVCALTGRTPQEFAELKTRFAGEESGLTD